MHAALLNPSKYIKGAEFLGKDVTYTIKSVRREELEKDDETTESKGIIYFSDEAKGWVSNVTNTKALVAMFGTETDNWIGKRVTLWFDENVRAFGDKVGGIRVRGSPDLAQPVSFDLKLMKKKKQKITLIKTGTAQPARGAQQQQPATPKPKSTWSRIQDLADEYGFKRGDKDADLIALVKTATNGKPGKELNEADFTLVEAAMATALGAGAAPSDAPGPTAKEDEIPF